MARTSRKSNATLDRESSRLELLGHQNADLIAMNSVLRAKLADRDAEILRIQALLRITQVKLAQHDRRQRIDDTPRGPSFRERCKAYFAATGKRSVTAPQLIAWEKDNA